MWLVNNADATGPDNPADETPAGLPQQQKQHFHQEAAEQADLRYPIVAGPGPPTRRRAAKRTPAEGIMTKRLEGVDDICAAISFIDEVRKWTDSLIVD